MEFEKKKGFQESVGKRIIEALKTNESIEQESFSTCSCKPNLPSYNNYEEHEYKEYRNVQEDFAEKNSGSIDPSGVDVLVDLVTKLPPGVTKQTGAQIIRHTMEAMGISMDKVLFNAQKAQEELDQGIKNNINEIEEHRAKIKLLDEDIHKFRKKMQDLDSIINLFILSENKR